MTRTIKRTSAARFTFQIAIAGAFASAVVAGCSSDVKTVTIEECAGAPASGGHKSASGGATNHAMGGSARPIEMAGEAGTEPSEGAAGVSDSGGSGGSESVSGSGGVSGTGGMLSSGGTGGKSSGGSAGKGSGGSGGRSSGGSGGKSNSGGTSNNGGSPAALCGDGVVTSPEFCDDRTNTDLSYGCSACTTLSSAKVGVSQQCDACLQAANKPSSCYGCQDRRACYACLRQQPESFPDSEACQDGLSGDSDPDPDKDENYPYTVAGFSDLCFNPTSNLYKPATGGPAGPKARGLVCQAMVACILRTGCALAPGVSVFTDCYCGAGSTGCGTSKDFVPTGPCAEEIKLAAVPASTTLQPELAIEIGTHLGAPDFGAPYVVLPTAFHIVRCAADPHGCRDVCFPNSSSGGGTGGSSGAGGKAGTGGKAGAGGS